MNKHCCLIYTPRELIGDRAGYRVISYYRTITPQDDKLKVLDQFAKEVDEVYNMNSLYFTVHIINTESSNVESIYDKDYYFDDLVFIDDFEEFKNLVTDDILLDKLKKSLNEVKQYREGKISLPTLEEMYKTIEEEDLNGY